jgi:hypothetical protein
VEFTHADAGPDITGTGKALTVTLYTVDDAAVQLLPFVKLTDIVCALAVFHVTVIVLVPVPAVMDPPAEIAHVYPVIPAAVEYILPVEFTHANAGPDITGTGKALTVTVAVMLQPLLSV